jgi:hypothetical protein
MELMKINNKENMTIKTSDKDWLEIAIKKYSEKEPFSLIDDANIGLTEKDLKSAVNLIRGAKSKGFPWKQIVSVLASIGISGAGIYIIGLAIADPEPTSKLGLLVVGGLLMAVMGSFGTLLSLGVKFSVTASALGNTFNIKPE